MSVTKLEDSAAVKEMFYHELTADQQALFSFFVYYYHAIDPLEEYFWWNAYFMAQPKLWSATKAALNYFEDNEQLRLLEEMEAVLLSWGQPTSLVDFQTTREDLAKHDEWLAVMSSKHLWFLELAPNSLKLVGEHILNHSESFFVLE
ncbi:hypothetical protein ACX93W_14680 [Paenibacillus sp. CAU 1782]